MNTLSLMPWLVVLLVGCAAMPGTNVYKICAWNAGTMKIDPWRHRTAAAVRSVTHGLWSWFASLWTARVAFACVAVLMALLLANMSAAQSGLLLAVPAIVGAPKADLTAKRAQLLQEADALRNQDGTFKDDAARTAFDAKMTEVEAIDAQLRATPAPASGDPTPPVDQNQVRNQAIAEERARVVGIQSAVRTAKLPETFAADLVARGVTLDAARSEIFAKMADAQTGTETRQHLAIGEDAQDKFMRGATNWLLVKSGMADLVARAANPQKPDVAAIDPGEFRGMSLVELARETLVRAGRQVRGMDKMRMLADAFTVRGTITQSTSDFANLLENVMHKVLLAAYATQPDTWRRFCAQGTVSDFRAHNRYRMGSFGSLDALNANGEFKSKAIDDAEKATITASTKGNIINVSRQMIVNDDMGAFGRLLAMLGRAAGLSVEVDVYATLALNAGLGPTQSDLEALFHSNRANVGTGAALSAASLDADAAIMAAQTDPNGNEFLNLEPAVLLVPRGLRGQALVINESEYDPDTLANKAQMKKNVARGFFRDVVGTPRLTGTRRYMFADPNVAPVLEVAFLEGQTEPVLETRDGWNVDGAEMKVRFDYGVAAVDFRGAVTNAGA